MARKNKDEEIEIIEKTPFQMPIEEDASMIISAKNLVLPVSSFPIELLNLMIT